MYDGGACRMHVHFHSACAIPVSVDLIRFIVVVRHGRLFGPCDTLKSCDARLITSDVRLYKAHHSV
jgi:hypothetical protein